MPPTRTIPPAKAVKTERTHEENQERAYIAASRRSDRSLEARVESARRASEIHKKRTGRSLRVTEQDVINEEMYEEEDDDLPMQYRRLTAHLQTGSVDFNRRLAAYLTNQVAMRSAMEHLANSSYNMQYPQYAAQFAAQNMNTMNMFPSPFVRQQTASSTSASFRPAPYPNPHQQNFRQMHGRAYSTAGLAQTSDTTSPSMTQAPEINRRLSTPANLEPASSSSPFLPNTEGPHSASTDTTAYQTMGGFSPFWQDMGPFTSSLPPESMQMLGPALDPNDPLSMRLMGGAANYMGDSYFPWPTANQMAFPIKAENQQTPYSGNPFGGMATTLAPSALDSNTTDSLTAAAAAPQTSPPPPKLKTEPSAPSSGLDFSLSQESGNLSGFPVGAMLREDSQGSGLGGRSGQGTPGERFWDGFIEDDEWGEREVV